MDAKSLMEKVKELQLRRTAMDRQTEGIKKLYESALILGNSKLTDDYRQQLHFILDSELDCTAEIVQCVKSATQ